MIQIQLVDTVKGYLDIKEGTNFPINLGIADIRDISKRTGLFSKTITLPGNKNNNILLGSIYDVNVSTGQFNINILQKCQVISDGEVILDNLYFQLIAVNKKSNNINEEQYIEYQAVIKDTIGDFFTYINNYELTDLDFSDLNYNFFTNNPLRLIQNDITASYFNTWEEGYKFIVPWIDPKRKTENPINPSNTINLNEVKPAIYVRQYWDRIFSNAGYKYSFPEMESINFNKLVIPYNGSETQMLEEVKNEYKVIADRPTALNGVRNFTGSPATYLEFFPLTITNEISDVKNQWQPITGNFIPALSMEGSGKYTATFKFSFSFTVTNLETSIVIYTGSVNPLRLSPILSFVNTSVSPNKWNNGLILDNSSIVNGFTLNGGQDYTVSIVDAEITIPINEVIAGQQFVPRLQIRAATEGGGSRWNIFGGSTPANMQYSWSLTNLEVDVRPDPISIGHNFPIYMDSYVPKKIKQKDFIKSIAQMFNLYFDVDKLDSTNIIVKTRDRYYDDGLIEDWSDKLNKNVDNNITFIPELTNKSITLTYKEDKDIANTTYKEATDKIYGEQEVIFENEYVKNESVKEIIFSPTPMALTGFGAYLPILNGYNPASNMRILLDGGLKPTVGLLYYAGGGVYVSQADYNQFTHYDDVANPTMDINFGMSDYYFYSGNTTNNNLFNNYWRRTFNQIDNGKLFSGSFNLNTNDIRSIKLNSKIKLENSYWFINKIIDYNIINDEPTKVELISIEDNVKFRETFISTPAEINPIDVNGVLNDGWREEGGNSVSEFVTVNGLNNYTNQFTVGDITGTNNFSNSTEYIYIQGDNNIVEAEAFIVGNDNEVGPLASNSIIFGSNIIATQSNTVYTENIIMSPGSTFNGVPLVDILSGGNISDILYADLFNLFSTNTLQPGKYYRITDYQTIYDQPDFDAAGISKAVVVTTTAPISPLIVWANATNELISEAIYGINECRYDITFTNTEVMGVATKGRITYLKDINGNETSYDHFNVEFLRYETINGSGVYDNFRDTGFASINVPTFGTGCNDNKIKGVNFTTPSFGYENIFIIPSNTFGNNCDSNIIGDNSYGNIFGLACSNNILGYFSFTNLFGNLNISNTFGSNIFNNRFGAQFLGNTFGNYVSGNIFGFGASANKFSSRHFDNTFGNTFTYSTFGPGCSTNNFGNDCFYISFGSNCNSNLIGNNVNNVTQGNECGNVFNALTRYVTVVDNINGRTFTPINDSFKFNKDLHNIPSRTVTTTNNVITNLYTFNASIFGGFYSIEAIVNGNEVATGDTVIGKCFAAFKVIGGVVTQISTTTTDRKSNFPAGVTPTIDTDGTEIRVRVTGRNGSTIVWNGHITITK